MGDAERLRAAIVRLEGSRESHALWADHLATCDWCREDKTTQATVGTIEHQQTLMAEYDNVLAVLAEQAALTVRAETAEAEFAMLRDEHDDYRAHYVDPVEHARVVEALARVEALADEWGALNLTGLGTLSRPTTEALVHKMAADLRSALASTEDPT